MDFTPYIGAIVTVIIAIVGGYSAMKNANNQRFLELAAQIARIETKMDDLGERVEKHNNTIERTFRLESDMNTAFKRIDELKHKDERIEDKLDQLKIGGTE